MPYNSEQNSGKQQPIRQSKAPKGKLLKKDGKIPFNAEEGIVTETMGRFFLVSPNDNPENQLIECVPSGKIISPYSESTMIAVGDKVSFIRDEKFNSEQGVSKGKIIKVEERLSWLSRKAVGKSPTEHVIASNISHLIILVSITQPKYKKRLIDRYIVAAELGIIKPVIVVNKIDLKNYKEIADDFKVYKNLNIPVFYISALYSTGIGEFSEFIESKDVVLSGPSGSGKSTLINNLMGDNTQPVLEISNKTFKGQHATSNIRMLKLPGGGHIIDTPGIREFAIWGIKNEELALYFHDFDEFNPKCKYYPCTHRHEPGCSVIEAVEMGLIDEGRYISYLNIYDSLE